MRVQHLVLSCVAISLCGCANLTTAYRQYSSKDSVMIDVKQRAIISKPTIGSSLANDYQVCAEPFPDALSVLAASGSGSLSVKDQVALSGNGGFAESGAYVGMRTPSIQALRDAYYRLCEGQMNGSLLPGEYYDLSKRYHRDMVALIALEIFGNSVRTPPVTLTAPSVSSAGPDMNSLVAQDKAYSKKIQDLQSQSDALGTQLTAAQATATATPTDANKAAATKLADSKQSVDNDISANKKAQAAIDDAMKSVAIGQAPSVGASNIGAIAAAPALSDASVKAIADTVKTIVNNIVIGTDDVEDMCLKKMGELSVTPNTDKLFMPEEEFNKLPPDQKKAVKARVDIISFCERVIEFVGKRAFAANGDNENGEKPAAGAAAGASHKKEAKSAKVPNTGAPATQPVAKDKNSAPAHP